MIKLLKILLTVVVTDLFFFPLILLAFPGVNSKMVLAVIGLVLVVIEMTRKEGMSFPDELLKLLFCCGMVSLMSLISITVNQTQDTTYASYIVSASVWLSAAFTACWVIKQAHGRIDVPLVVHYLVGVCLMQCLFTMLIAFVPAFSDFVDRYFDTGQNLMKGIERLYGIGALLDVAGTRFSAVLVAIAFLLVSSPRKVSNWMAVFYTFSFIVISVIGNMIARTTTIGMLMGVAWFIVGPFIVRRRRPAQRGSGKGFTIFATIALLVAISIWLYNTIPVMEDLFRFGFEGFFAYVEEGKWQVSSNEILKGMVVWPEELHTWIIGDGYFLNSRYDPNYLGDATDEGFYMGTDIGYLRFIFYFGIAGLVWIIAVVTYSAYVCCQQFKEYTWLFLMALAVALTVWAKVSTDIFLFFCLFLCTAALREETELSPETAPTS